MAITEYTWNPLTDSVIEETDGAGNVLVEYVNEPSAYGPLLSQHKPGEDRYFHFDALGSTRTLTDEDGEVTDTFAYDAWGITTDQHGPSEVNFGWIGRWGYSSSNTTNTHSVRFRTLKSSLARWLAADPLWPVLAPSPVYTIANNSPARLIDPSGLACGDTIYASMPDPQPDPRIRAQVISVATISLALAPGGSCSDSFGDYGISITIDTYAQVVDTVIDPESGVSRAVIRDGCNTTSALFLQQGIRVNFPVADCNLTGSTLQPRGGAGGCPIQIVTLQCKLPCRDVDPSRCSECKECGAAGSYAEIVSSLERGPGRGILARWNINPTDGCGCEYSNCDSRLRVIFF